MQTQKKHPPGTEMHKYVWMFLGIFALIAATYPTAMLRISQKEKFQGYHVKSWTIEGKLADPARK